jgi:hypothetical protein
MIKRIVMLFVVVCLMVSAGCQEQETEREAMRHHEDFDVMEAIIVEMKARAGDNSGYMEYRE